MHLTPRSNPQTPSASSTTSGCMFSDSPKVQKFGALEGQERKRKEALQDSQQCIDLYSCM